MQAIKKFQVKTNLPEELKKIEEIAYNYWWCWDPQAWELFNRIDTKLFARINHNPVQLLNLTSQSRLKKLAESEEFKSFLGRVYSDFADYMKKKKWFDRTYPDTKGSIAYFSPEYGINESFPNYSGGLGVLSGDHVKSASDLGLPMVAIGLLYQEGYFRQHILDNGWQTEKYNNNDFYNLPLKQVTKDNGEPLILEIQYPEDVLYYAVWELNAGTTRLFLLDTNLEQNSSEEYRKITSRLYGGDRETRIQQELLLGVGGAKALDTMGINCSCYHINEGHAAFALLERTSQFMYKYDMNFWEACQITKTSTVFTTHTPVPAGNEEFELGLVEKYLLSYIESLGLKKNEFISFGHQNGYNPEEYFSMTVMGLRLSTYHNGVSKLHGEVSRGMWKGIWNNLPESEVPIGHVTNGIHTHTFVAPELSKLYDRYIGSEWRTDTDNRSVWDKARDIPDEELWNEKQRLRMQLIRMVRERISNSDIRPTHIGSEDINGVLNPEALTIGFARRFATYKRADLIFRDMERLSSIIKNQDKPVQILIAGKAHPHDTQGKETIQRIIKKVRKYGLEKSILFIEDYDMVIARALVRGCDVWLNNPIRPLEASGTSGMKSSLNGGLNLSVLDGWWDEGYNGNNGFAIGEGEESPDLDLLAEVESNIIYDMLESRVTKLFYDRHSYGIPRRWTKMMKEAIATLSPVYSTNRMVKDYSTLYYSEAINSYNRMIEKPESAKELYNWIEGISQKWDNVRFEKVEIVVEKNIRIGGTISAMAILDLAGIDPDSVKVEVYHGRIGIDGEIEAAAIAPMGIDSENEGKYTFSTELNMSDSGLCGATVRVLPYHKLLNEPFQLYMCKWADD
jgi:starch phosphorylase